MSQDFQFKSLPNINKENSRFSKPVIISLQTICDVLHDLVSVTIWHLYDRSSSHKCMLTSVSTFLSLLYVCMY